MDNIFSFTWTIENFKNCSIPTGEAILSPVFVADTPYRTHWRLKLYPRGLKDPKFVTCFLKCHDHNEPRERRVRLKITIIGVDTRDNIDQTLEDIKVSNSCTVGFRELVSWETLNSSRLLPLGFLTIRCLLRSVPRLHPGDEALLKLSQTFKKLYLSRDFTNLTLKSGREKFQVHRQIICARAPIYSRKLSLMQPRSQNTSKYRSKAIVDFPSTTLKAFLLYLYCGVMESPAPDVWNGLYDLGERYQLYDMQRAIFPSPTNTAFRTRAENMSTSIVLAIENFSSAPSANLGRMVELGFARVGVEYYRVDDKPAIEFLLWCFVDDPRVTDRLFCTVSALDVNGVKHFESENEVEFDGPVTAVGLNASILRESVQNDSFLSSQTLRINFVFTVVSGLEPTRIDTVKTCKALCLGNEPPSYITLNRLSQDLEQLVDGGAFIIDHPDEVKREAILRKAILSAWSPAFARMLHEQTPEITPIPETDTGKLVFRFLCTGRIAIHSFKIASDVYTVAKMHGIDSLRQICLRNMTSKLAKDNVVDSLIFAYTQDEEEFYASSQDFVCRYQDEILITEEWKSLSRRYPYVVKKVMAYLRLE